MQPLQTACKAGGSSDGIWEEGVFSLLFQTLHNFVIWDPMDVICYVLQSLVQERQLHYFDPQISNNTQILMKPWHTEIKEV